MIELKYYIQNDHRKDFPRIWNTLIVKGEVTHSCYNREDCFIGHSAGSVNKWKEYGKFIDILTYD